MTLANLAARRDFWKEFLQLPTPAAWKSQWRSVRAQLIAQSAEKLLDHPS